MMDIVYVYVCKWCFIFNVLKFCVLKFCVKYNSVLDKLIFFGNFEILYG